MRLRLIAAGKSTSDEIFLMVNEKVDALEEARAILLRGGDANQIIDNTENSRCERRPPIARSLAVSDFVVFFAGPLLTAAAPYPPTSWTLPAVRPTRDFQPPMGDPYSCERPGALQNTTLSAGTSPSADCFLASFQGVPDNGR